MSVMTGRDVLERPAPPQHRRIVIAGGGCAGAQTAEYLAHYGNEVTVLEAEGDIAIDAPSDERNLLLARLQRRGVKLMPNTRLLNMTLSSAVVLLPNETRTLPADMVVLCLGSRSMDELMAHLGDSGVPTHLIGDAVRPRKVTEAMAEGAAAVLDLLERPLEPALRQEIEALR
jgi:pyruvate/2-oxoglutarate dehydrogenase complex dihydrolipoamide dehydrogenase (E3) component